MKFFKIMLRSILFTIFFNPNNIIAQDVIIGEAKKNIFFLEAGGNGVFFSINLERIIYKNISVRSGFGTALITGKSIPFMVNYYLGNEKKIELGIGIVYVNSFENNSFLGEPNSFIITSTIGHSHQPLRGGITFRFSFTPFYVPSTKKFIPYLGISGGFNF